MTSDRKVKFTEADIKLLSKEQENTNIKKKISHHLKQFSQLLAKQTKEETFENFRAAGVCIILKVSAFDSLLWQTTLARWLKDMNFMLS